MRINQPLLEISEGHICYLSLIAFKLFKLNYSHNSQHDYYIKALEHVVDSEIDYGRRSICRVYVIYAMEVTVESRLASLSRRRRGVRRRRRVRDAAGVVDVARRGAGNVSANVTHFLLAHPRRHRPKGHVLYL